MRLNLISKLTIVTGIVLLIAMVLFAWLNIQSLKNLLLEEAVVDADNLGETIIRSAHYSMLENDLPRVYEMISEVGTQKRIERIRLITKDGIIAFSTKKEEIGKVFDKKAAACNMCHTGEAPLLHASTMNRSRIFREKDGKEVLGIARGIYNEDKCSTAACHFHPKSSRILGVLDVTVSLDSMNAQLVSQRNKKILFAVLQLGLLILCLTYFMMNLVSLPVRQLLVRTREIAEGDLESSIPVQSHDELGELAESFNSMTARLKDARMELVEWAQTLEVKVEERTHKIKQMQAQLIRAEKLASQGELVAGIAHEINNPLTGILVYASLIRNDPRFNPELRLDMQTVIRETERCAGIVKGLLDFSRETPPEKKLVDLYQIMEDSLKLVGHQSLFHDITITKRSVPGLPKVMADHNQIMQVFINILLNAGQSMPGGGNLDITSGVTENGCSVFVAIADTGQGIPEEYMGKIFDPFFSTKDQKGTGLGLSVSFGIIANHGGTIGVESQVGKGTTFTIYLPLKGEEYEGVGGD